MKPSALLAASALLALQLVSTLACSCISTDFQTQYFREVNAGKDVVQARVLKTYIRKRPSTGPLDINVDERVYILKVTKTYGCKRSTLAVATTATNSAACGVNLRFGVTYLTALRRTGTTPISLCGITREFSSLSAANKQFLNTRETCCFGSCKCLNAPRVNCFVNPCRFAKRPCAEAVKCVDNYCGGCFAEWFTKDNLPACKTTQ